VIVVLLFCVRNKQKNLPEEGKDTHGSGGSTEVGAPRMCSLQPR